MDADPATVRPGDDVRTLLELLREHALPGVPVVDQEGRLAGIVTESDLVLREDDADLHLPHFVELLGGVVFLEPLQHFEAKLRKAFATTVSDMMTTDVLTVTPDASVHEAAQLISSSGHNRLPVVDGDRVVGVVTRVDCLAALSGGE